MNSLALTPIDELSFKSLSQQSIRLLKKAGIVTLGLLTDLIEKRPDNLTLFKLSLKDINQECDLFIQKNTGQKNFSFNRQPIIVPPMGMMLAPKDSTIIMQRRAATQSQRIELAKIAMTLKSQLPDEYLLVDKMQAIRNQGNLGSCTGFGSINAREYLVQQRLSAGFAYRGAKYLDGHPELEGSWQEFAFEFMYQYGSLKERVYPYQYCLENKPIKPYLSKAKKYKLSSYVDLLVEPEYLPLVLKAALSGYLVPEIAPQPVSISVVIYESFCDPSAYSTGLIPVPLAHEKQHGGHAMCVCGYTTLYGIPYFIVINSWGENFAKNSPVNLKGYALIPEAYVSKPGLVAELILPIH